jgi:hypothetical protein
MAATSMILTGPTPIEYLGGIQGKVGVATGNFTVTPNDVFTGTVTMSDLSIADQTQSGGTFTPSSLTFSGTSTPQTFTYTPAKVGRQLIKIDAHPSITKSSDILIITTS